MASEADILEAGLKRLRDRVGELDVRLCQLEVAKGIIDWRKEYKKAAMSTILGAHPREFILPDGRDELASQAAEFADAMIAEDEQHAKS